MMIFARAQSMALRFFGALAASACTAAIGAAQAAPQIIGSSYIETISKNCGNVEVCIATMTAVPAGRVLRVSHVSCHVEFNGLGVEVINIGAGLANPVYLTPQLISSKGTRRFYQSSNQVLLPVPAGSGTAPIVTMRVTPNPNVASINLSVTCQISGAISAS